MLKYTIPAQKKEEPKKTTKKPAKKNEK